MPRTGSGDGPHRSRVSSHTISKRTARNAAAAAVLATTAFAFLGCATVLGIDEDYAPESASSSSGGTASQGKGGATGSGAKTSTGGALASSGGAGTSAGGVSGAPDSGGRCTEGGSDCSGGTKCCNGSCVAPAPLVGCGLDSCSQCDPPPAFGTIACVSSECTIQCNPNYVLDGLSGLCEPAASNNSGGAPGAGGASSTGGAAAACDAAKCKACVPAGAFGCCKNNDECGCTWAPGAYCM